MKNIFLDFEQPIADLEAKFEALAGRVSARIRRRARRSRPPEHGLEPVSKRHASGDADSSAARRAAEDARAVERAVTAYRGGPPQPGRKSSPPAASRAQSGRVRANPILPKPY